MGRPTLALQIHAPRFKQGPEAKYSRYGFVVHISARAELSCKVCRVRCHLAFPPRGWGKATVRSRCHNMIPCSITCQTEPVWNCKPGEFHAMLCEGKARIICPAGIAVYPRCTTFSMNTYVKPLMVLMANTRQTKRQQTACLRHPANLSLVCTLAVLDRTM